VLVRFSCHFPARKLRLPIKWICINDFPQDFLQNIYNLRKTLEELRKHLTVNVLRITVPICLISALDSRAYCIWTQSIKWIIKCLLKNSSTAHKMHLIYIPSHKTFWHYTSLEDFLYFFIFTWFVLVRDSPAEKNTGRIFYSPDDFSNNFLSKTFNASIYANLPSNSINILSKMLQLPRRCNCINNFPQDFPQIIYNLE